MLPLTSLTMIDNEVKLALSDPGLLATPDRTLQKRKAEDDVENFAQELKRLKMAMVDLQTLVLRQLVQIHTLQQEQGVVTSPATPVATGGKSAAKEGVTKEMQEKKEPKEGAKYEKNGYQLFVMKARPQMRELAATKGFSGGSVSVG